MTSTTPGTEGSSPGFEPSLLPCMSMVLSCCPLSAENSLLTLGLCPRWSLCLEPMSDRKLCGLPPDVSQVSAQKSLWNGYSCMSYLPILSLTLSVPLPSFISSNTCHYLFIYLFLLVVSPFHWNVSFTRQRLGLSISIVTVPLTLRISVIK